MNVCIVLVTLNRVEYTKKTIARLLEDPNEEFELYLWDNASTDGTPEYLMDGVKDPRIVETVLSKENVGQVGAMNYVWSKTKAELIGKLDNDCLVTPGWTRILAKAHEDVEDFGAVACWRFLQDEFDERAARKAGKIQSFGRHQIFRHPWVVGSGFLLKRSTFVEVGPWDEGFNVGTTDYFMKMALAGYINGCYYPLVYHEHMDDPFSKHCITKDDKAINSAYDITYTLRNRNIRTVQKRMAWRKVILDNVNSGPWEAKYYVGWRRKLRNGLQRVRDILKV